MSWAIVAGLGDASRGACISILLTKSTATPAHICNSYIHGASNPQSWCCQLRSGPAKNAAAAHKAPSFNDHVILNRQGHAVCGLVFGGVCEVDVFRCYLSFLNPVCCDLRLGIVHFQSSALDLSTLAWNREIRKLLWDS